MQQEMGKAGWFAAGAPAVFARVWDRFWFGDIPFIRPYLLKKGILILLAFDVWVLRLDRAAVFGLDGFNIAHFDWLDAVQPLPGPGLYSGLMLLVGIIAIVCALVPTGRWLLALLALIYTYGWAMSLLDGYQHHYLLSLFLTAFIFFPVGNAILRASGPKQGFSNQALRAAPEKSGPPRKRRPPAINDPQRASAIITNETVGAWAYVLLGVNIALVYAFTAFAKLEEPWRAGEVLQHIGKVKSFLKPMESALVELGFSQQGFWTIAARSVIAGELLIALGYVAAIHKDSQGGLWRSSLSWLAFIAAIGFHVSLEFLTQLRIGWFAYYMIWTACIYFLPTQVLHKLMAPLCWLWTKTAGLWRGSQTRTQNDRGKALEWIVAVIVIVAAGFVCFEFLDMPGARPVGIVISLGLLGATGIGFLSGRFQESLRCVFATGAAIALLWGALTYSDVRFRYYARIAYQMALRDNPRSALAAYEKASLYASPDHPRQKDLEKNIREIRRFLQSPEVAQK